jgi:acetyl-CoA carboxylase/biotin carboxylase 1
LVSKFKALFRRTAVAQLEIRLCGSQGEAAWRVAVSLPTGHENGEEHVEVYREVPTRSLPGEPELLGENQSSCETGICPLGPNLQPFVFRHHSSCESSSPVPLLLPQSPLHGQLVLGPYPPLEPLQQRRLAARRHAVTYCYDFPSVFEDALREIWAGRVAAGEEYCVGRTGSGR